MEKRLQKNWIPSILKTALMGGVCFALSLNSFAGTNGYNYRAKSTGNWEDISTWERFNTTTSSWENILNVADLPDATAGTITISNNQEVSVNSPLIADQLIINGTLFVYSTLTIPANAPAGISLARELNVFGTLQTNNNIISGNGNLTLVSGSTIGLGSGAGFALNHNSGNIQNKDVNILSNVTFIYNGTVPQITGDGIPDGANLIIDNATGVTLSAAKAVSNLTLTQGTLTTSTANTLVIPYSGLVTGGSATSYVNGPLAFRVDTNVPVSLNFPIGKNGNFRPVSLDLTQVAVTSTLYTAEQIEGAHPQQDLSTNATINRISKIRYFTINQSIATGLSNSKVKLSYGSDDGVTSVGGLTVANYNGTQWVDLNVATSPSNGKVEASSNIASFGSFVLANKIGGSNPLPVALISFNAKGVDKNVKLTWNTASEKNNDRFDVERSLDGKNFEKIASVKGNGSTNAANAYSITDFNPAQSLNYYRLKQIDLDGAFSYSQIVKVQLNAITDLYKVYPNPATDKITVLPGKPGVLIITNVLGQVVYSQEFKYTSEQVINIANLKPGVYHLNLETANGSQKQKFVKAGF